MEADLKVVVDLGWQRHRLALHNLRHVQVEEVTVEDGLDNTGHNSDDVIEAFEVEAINPVEDVETPVGAEGEEIVAGDRLCLPCLADHEQLRQDGHRLEVDGEGPEHLHGGKLVIEHES